MDQHPSNAADKFDDEHYPAYTMGRAADMLNTTPAFLRALDEAGLLQPQRSAGGHRRFTRHQLRIAARVRELVDQGTAMAAACRIVSLEDELAEARRHHSPTRTRPSRSRHNSAYDSAQEPRAQEPGQDL